MTRHLAIETAYARNQANPLTLDLDGRTFTFDPSLDVGRLAVLFNRFQEGLSSMGDENRPMAERIAAMADKRAEGLNALRECIAPAEQAGFVEWTADRLDVMALSNIITWLLTEVSGQPTPTPPPSSSNGSAAGGPSSTGGAAPEASTPSASPPTAP